MSIWAGLERGKFEQNVAELVKLAGNRDLSNLRKSRPKPRDEVDTDNDDLDPVTERQIAQNFAYLAAWERSPRCVTAASVLRKPNHTGIRIAIAGNHGIEPLVEKALENILRKLESCALRRKHLIPGVEDCDKTLIYSGTSRKACAASCLETVLGLHRNRVFWRIGSPRFKPIRSDWPRTKIKRLSPGLERIALQLKLGKSVSQQNCRLLASRIRSLVQKVEQVEQGIEENNVLAMVAIVDAAYQVTLAMDCLSNPKLLTDTDNVRVVRHVRALAAYLRICTYLAAWARQYRNLFSSIGLDIVRFGNNTRVTHAEIQLLVHHDMAPDQRLPRAIASSKKTCFLCDCFFRAYGHYRVLETHGQIYGQWNLPDLPEFGQSLRNKLNAATQATARDIEDTLISIRRPGRRLGHPLQHAQSMIIQHVAQPATPSALTLDSGASHCNAKQHLQTKDATEHLVERHDSGKETSPTKSDREPSLLEACGDPLAVSKSMSLVSNQHGGLDELLYCQWLEMHVVREDGVDARSTVNDNTATRKLGPANEDEYADIVVNIADLDKGEITIRKPDGADEVRLRVRRSGYADLMAVLR